MNRLLMTWCAALATLAAFAAPSVSADAATVNPLAGKTFYVDPYNSANRALSQYPETAHVVRRIAQTPQARWFGDWTPAPTVAGQVSTYVADARKAGALPLLVLYAVPHRDCNWFSAGGLDTPAEYQEWVRQVTLGINGRPAVVVVEPDALTLTDCLTAEQQTQRFAMLANAAAQLARSRNTVVYLDAGNSNWLPAAEVARRLQLAGVAKARGFSLNVSNFNQTSNELAFGEAVSSRIGGKAYVVDTSRNGLGPLTEGPMPWCNPSGRALGATPTTVTGGRRADAYLWIKNPGESDGSCDRGEPSAGQWWNEYAVGLVERSPAAGTSATSAVRNPARRG